MTQSVAILGRQPALGLAELESLYGSDNLIAVGRQAVLCNLSPSDINLNYLGGTIKLGKLLTTLDTTSWPEIAKWLAQTTLEHLQYLPEGKLQLGLSVYGLNVNISRLNASGLEVKKAIRAAGRSVRLIPNKTHELNSAQVLHNHLTDSLGWEFLFIKDGSRTHVAQTVAVQDIEAYAARDQARPKRDARVGMLPPKLAQIIVNLAVSPIKEKGRASFTPYSLLPTSPVLLDPFCGTGVVLQESLLMGYRAYGSDLEPRMVEYTAVNLKWLTDVYRIPHTAYRIETADATNHTWQTFDTIACETYLGRPFSALPPPKVLSEVMQDVNTIHRKFLRNVARQTKPGLRMCIAIPAWKTKNGFKHLPTLDSLEEMGYTRVSFAHVSNQDLIYHRPEQIVARELVVLQRS